MRSADEIEGMLIAIRERIRHRSIQIGKEPLTKAIEFLVDHNHDDRTKIDALNWVLEVNANV